MQAQSVQSNIISTHDTLEKLTYLDENIDTIFNQIQDKINQTQGVEQMLWHNYMATHLYAYYNTHKYQIEQRTPIADKSKLLQPISQWDLQTIVEQILTHFVASLQNEQLLYEQNVDDYKELFSNMNKFSEQYNQTLLEVLAFQALNFYTLTLSEIPIPIQPFECNNKAYFTNIENFRLLNIQTTDSLNPHYLALKLFQKLSQLYQQQNDIKMLLHINIERLNFLQKQSTLSDKNELYIQALSDLEKKYHQQNGYEQICYQIGYFYQLRANEYDKYISPQYQNDNQKALDWYQKAVDFAPNSLFAYNSLSQQEKIKQPQLEIYSRTKTIPQQKSLYKLTTRNIDTVYAAIIAIDKQEFLKLQEELYNSSKKQAAINKLTNQKFLNEWTIVVPHNKDYRTVNFDCLLPALPIGNFAILLSNSNLKEHPQILLPQYFEVSQIGISRFQNKNNELIFFVYDELTGQPIEQAKVEFEKNNTKNTEKIATLFTDKNGLCSLKKTSNNYMYLRANAYYNKSYATTSFSLNYTSSSVHISPKKNVYTFTDRAIYRPGQQVFFKSILVYSDSNNHAVIPNHRCVVKLFDHNWQNIDSLPLTTNEFGSISGSFIIPEEVLGGNFTMKIYYDQNQSDNHSIRVEEYKRPSFEITVNQPDSSFKLNETIQINGNVKAYAGYAIDNASIKYRVVRQTSFPYWKYWYYRPSQPEKEIANGDLRTDKNGNFSFNFVAEANQKLLKFAPLCNYLITITATDINGETHSTTQTIYVGKKSLDLFADIPQTIHIQNDKSFSYSISASNLAGKPQIVQVNYQIEQLATPKHFLYERQLPNNSILLDSVLFANTFPRDAYNENNNPLQWKTLKTIQKGKLVTDENANITLQNPQKWDNGYYKITLSAKDKFGEDVIIERIFFLNSDKNKAYRQYNALAINTDKYSYCVGDTIHLQLSTYLNNAYIVFEMFDKNNSTINTYKLNQETKDFSIIVGKEHLDEILFRAVLVQNEHYYVATQTVHIYKETPKTLSAEFVHFRDYLLPGQNEQWQIKIKSNKDEKINTELLCTMYDASLDAFVSNNWNIYLPQMFTPLYRLTSFYTPSIQYDQENCYFPYTSKPNIPLAHYSWRKILNIYRYYYGDSRLYATGATYRKNTKIYNSLYDNVLEYGSVERTVVANEDILEEETAENETSEQIRSNFAETAFFLPHLTNSADGEIVFSATLPESLTKWKMMGLIHDKEMTNTKFEKFLYTQKPLMVIPNYPRFFREGDTITFAVKIVNLSKEIQKGTLNITFFDAQTNNPLSIIKGDSAITFTIKGNESQLANFILIIPKHIAAITYKVAAKSGQYTDIEQRMIPVLSNRMMITESLPFYINGQGKKHIVFDRLQKAFALPQSSIEHYKYTIEFTANPIWYVVQALPYLMTYPYDCNEQTFSKFYANSIAKHIVDNHGEIQDVFQKWQQEQSDAFLSQLEKNKELKSIALQETPWLLNAQSESADKKQIASLFDSKKIHQELENAKQKLQKAQNSDGGWSWFKGGIYSSLYITTHIVSGFGHLATMNINDHSLEKTTIKKAVAYLDNQMQDRYNYLKKHDMLKIAGLYYSDIQYLYARTFFLKKIPIHTTHKEMYNYFVQQIKTHWNQYNWYGQTLAALTLYRQGEVGLAKQILKDIKSKAQYSDEMGMWWKKEGYGYFWYEAPIERQSLMIEAFETILHDTESVAKMQLWLLKQKQTQHWATTKANTEACYALLMRNSASVIDTNAKTTLTIGNQAFFIDTLKDAQAGSKYVKLKWDSKDISSDLANITIEKETQGSSWGAAYWQYEEDLDKITNANTPLYLEKKLYKVVLSNNGERLQEITDQSPIKVGDKICVRVILKADRDMEYLHLKDMRASAFEPTNVLSSYKYQDGLIYYESTKDAATHFFIEQLQKGTYVFEYRLIATQKGSFSNGVANIECMYAPEFSAHSNGIRIKVE